MNPYEVQRLRAKANVYIYNLACHCTICTNQGHVPQGTPDNGHSFAYEQPHIPPHADSVAWRIFYKANVPRN